VLRERLNNGRELYLLTRVQIMTLNASILLAYELVPEAYRQHFCQLQKTELQNHMEFAREQACLFDRCGSQDKNLEDLDTHPSPVVKHFLHKRVAT
jgi:hypothetical protein